MASHLRYPLGCISNVIIRKGGVNKDINRGFKENSRSGNMLICIYNVVSTHKNVKTTRKEETKFPFVDFSKRAALYGHIEFPRGCKLPVLHLETIKRILYYPSNTCRTLLTNPSSVNGFLIYPFPTSEAQRWTTSLSG